MENTHTGLRLAPLFLFVISLFYSLQSALAASPSSLSIIPVDPATVKNMLERPLQRNFVPGQIIVKMKPSAALLSPNTMTAMGFDPKMTPTSGEREFIFHITAATMEGVATAVAMDKTSAAVKTMQERPDVEYAQLNYIFQIQLTPNDQQYPMQWHYFDRGNGANQSPGGISLPTRWDLGTGDNSVVVAVIDTGILPNHEDIIGSPNLIPGYDMISDTFIANDGNGRDSDPTDPGDAFAANECGPGSPARGSSWHGTHVAGTVGVGRTNNNIGIAGVNWKVSVQPVRVLGKCGGTSADINDAIRWAAGLSVGGVPTNSTPAKVINMSLGGLGACSSAPATQSAINDAVNAGTTVVVAAGNSAENAANHQPASCNNVITVAASDYRGHLVSRYSNFGSTVEIMAPGGDVARDDNGDGSPDGVLSMVNGGYSFYNGTSMAAPHVAGVAALLLADNPNRTPAQITALIQANAIPRSTVECPQPCGAGLLNANFSPGQQLLNVTPANLNLNIGDSSTITATLTQGGQPLAGEAVSFTSNETQTVGIISSDSVTNSSGIAIATVEGVAAGITTIKVTAQNNQRAVSVEVKAPSVPALSTWSILFLVAIILLFTPRWKRT